jgi:hypothetical protein
MLKKIIIALLILLMAASVAAADTIYLRDGRTVRGTILGFVNGRFVVRLEGNVSATGQAGVNTTNTSTGAAVNQNGQIVLIRPNQIERIEIEGRSLDEARFVTRTVQVGLSPNWIDSGVDLRRGDRVQIKAGGVIYAGRMRITPDGLRTTDPNAPLPRAAEGVLIATVGTDPDAPITEIGINREFNADRDGRLYLTANRSNYTDARGAFSVEIRTENELFNRTTAGRRNETDRRDETDRDVNDYDPFGTGNNQARTDPAPVRPRNPQGYPVSTNTGAETRLTREKSIIVPANISGGTDTGIELRSGDQVTITASGNITAGRRAGVVSPEGGRAGLGSIIGTRPLPQAGVGALIGYLRLSNGQVSQPFFVGSQLNFSAQADGRLFLLVNDDNYSDNSGSFDVRILYPEYSRTNR